MGNLGEGRTVNANTQRHLHTRRVPRGASDHRHLATTDANWVHRPRQTDVPRPKDYGLTLMMHTWVSDHRLAGCFVLRSVGFRSSIYVA